MSYRHVNPNMISTIILGVQEGEHAARQPGSEALLQLAYEDLEAQHAALTPPGDRPIVVGQFLKAKALAHTQGFIAGYRSVAEQPETHHPACVKYGDDALCAACNA